MSDFDDRLRDVLRPFDIKTPKSGEHLTCLRCGRDVVCTFHDLCGSCYLRRPKPDEMS